MELLIDCFLASNAPDHPNVPRPFLQALLADRWDDARHYYQQHPDEDAGVWGTHELVYRWVRAGEVTRLTRLFRIYVEHSPTALRLRVNRRQHCDHAVVSLAQIAVAYDRLGSLRLLLEAGAEPEGLHPGDPGLLTLASTLVRPTILQWLIAHQPALEEIWVGDSEEETPLGWWANANVPEPKDLATARRVFVDARGYETTGRATALYYALVFGRIQNIEILLRVLEASGSDAQTAVFLTDRRSPLRLAVRMGKLNISFRLLRFGAGREERSPVQNKTLLMLCLESPQLDPAYARARADLIHFLASDLEQLNAQDRSGERAVFYAVRANDLESLEILANAGARLDEVGFSGLTPLMVAVKHPQAAKILRWLVRKGVALSVPAQGGMMTGRTALQMAVQSRAPREVLQAFFAGGSELDPLDLLQAIALSHTHYNHSAGVFLSQQYEERRTRVSRRRRAVIQEGLREVLASEQMYFDGKNLAGLIHAYAREDQDQAD